MALTVVFFGTPEFAVPALSGLLEARTAVPLVVTQPDRPVGRHAVPVPSAVSRLAAVRGIPSEKPEKLRGNTDLADRIRGLAPDVGVVVAYGRLLPPELLAIPATASSTCTAHFFPGIGARPRCRRRCSREIERRESSP